VSGDRVTAVIEWIKLATAVVALFTALAVLLTAAVGFICKLLDSRPQILEVVSEVSLRQIMATGTSGQWTGRSGAPQKTSSVRFDTGAWTHLLNGNTCCGVSNRLILSE
jgi:hypothetical protein